MGAGRGVVYTYRSGLAVESLWKFGENLHRPAQYLANAWNYTSVIYFNKMKPSAVQSLSLNFKLVYFVLD